MPRNAKCRNICSYPDYLSFVPEFRDDGELETIVLSLDEYEAFRLLDAEGLNQEECAKKMGVARTTVTAIYESARKKIAQAFVEGKRLLISGGNIKISDFIIPKNIGEKGKNTMRVAVTYDNGEIFQHFGRTEQFKVFDIEDGQVKSGLVVDTNGAGHGALAGFLKTADVDALICGGIGGGAQMALMEAGITLYAGISGSADEAAKALAEGKLIQNTEANCDHHDHEHGEGHECGHHAGGCGNHGCHS
ncbi:MAG: DUF134 domain-containing protein [Eubacterium sp.]|nr:DUF134 domain-containing protein [Eubacterium sp.]